MKFIAAFFFVITLAACATALTSKGRAITVVNSMSAALASDCKRLGSVTGYAKAGWGNDLGLDQAFNDARNKAGEISGADTLAVSMAQRKFSGGEVTGVVFDCSQQRVQLIQNVAPTSRPPTAEPPANVFELAKKCQDRGGVWINNQCVIKVE